MMCPLHIHLWQHSRSAASDVDLKIQPIQRLSMLAVTWNCLLLWVPATEALQVVYTRLHEFGQLQV